MDIPGIDIPGPGDVIGGVGGFFGGLAEDAGRAIVEYVLEFIFGLIAQAVASITGALAQSFNGASTRVDLIGGWFSSDGGSTVTTMTSVIAGSLVLVFLFMSLIRAMFAGEFSTMWSAALVDVPIAFLATALTVVVASALLAMVDEASATLLGADGEQLAAFGDSLSDIEQLSLAGLLGILFGLLFIVGAVLVWIQLLVRAALIYIVIAFAPITWVTRAYPGTRGIARRGVEVAIALILSKFVMAISFRLGAEALDSSEVPSGEADLSAMLLGSAIMLMTAFMPWMIMLMTAFMPWMIFKIIPAVESATSAAGPQSAAVGAAVVGGGLAIAGLRGLAGGGGSGAAAGRGSGGSLGTDGSGSDGGGGGDSAGQAGGGGAGLVASAAKSTVDAAEAGAQVVATTVQASRTGGNGQGSGTGGSASGAASSDESYPATPVGGSPGVAVIGVGGPEPSPPPPTQPSPSGTSGDQPLGRLRKRRES